MGLQQTLKALSDPHSPGDPEPAQKGAHAGRGDHGALFRIRARDFEAFVSFKRSRPDSRYPGGKIHFL